MWAWIRRRRTERELVERDARALLQRFGDDAYGEARMRAHGAMYGEVDGNRPEGHWLRVKEAIGRRERDRR